MTSLASSEEVFFSDHEQSDPLRMGPSGVPVRLDALALGRSPRVGGVDDGHVRLLASRYREWPPIVVRRSGYVVVDGIHRYHAALALGHQTIDCVFIDCPEGDAFVEAIRRNRGHGLALSLQDRKHSARVILELNPDWSDRRVAVLCGLAHGTVGSMRADLPVRPYGQDRHLGTRRGLDGRLRPEDPEATRQRVLAVLRDQPHGSLRHLASIAGASPETVRKVRAQSAQAPVDGLVTAPTTLRAPKESVPPAWIADHALRTGDDGQELLKWLAESDVDDRWMEWARKVPLGRTYEVADEARRRSKIWAEFASALETRAGRRPRS